MYMTGNDSSAVSAIPVIFSGKASTDTRGTSTRSEMYAPFVRAMCGLRHANLYSLDTSKSTTLEPHSPIHISPILLCRISPLHTLARTAPSTITYSSRIYPSTQIQKPSFQCSRFQHLNTLHPRLTTWLCPPPLRLTAPFPTGVLNSTVMV